MNLRMVTKRMENRGILLEDKDTFLDKKIERTFCVCLFEEDTHSIQYTIRMWESAINAE